MSPHFQLCLQCNTILTHGTYLKLSLFLSKTVADCLKLSQSSNVSKFVANLSHVPAPKAHTSLGTIHGYIHSWNDPAQPDPHPPGLLLPHHPAGSCLPSQPHPARHASRPGQPCPPTWPAKPANPASHAPPTRPSVPPTRPAVSADPARRARRPGPSCPPTRPAKPANPPSRADQPGHVRCFGRDAVDPASLVSSSFLLISAS